MQVLPDIYEINGSEFGRWQNSFLVNHAGATVIFDSGDMGNRAVAVKDLPATAGLPEVEENAAIWGFALEDASHLFVTHEHFDHASHAAELQRRGLTIVASQATAEAMAVADRRVIGWAHASEVEPCDVDVALGDGDEVTIGDLTIRGISIPGHTNGSMVFDVVVHGSRNWFVGDLLSTVTAHRSVELPWMGDVNSDRGLYTESLEKLLDYPVRPDNIFPGHGPTAIGTGYDILEMAYHLVMSNWRSGRHQR